MHGVLNACIERHSDLITDEDDVCLDRLITGRPQQVETMVLTFGESEPR